VVSTVAGVSLAQHPSPRAIDPTTDGSPAYHDFVAGTDVDEAMQATVSRHLPDVAAATEVYPSDWNHAGPIPDADFADATEWHAVYDVAGAERLTVVMSDEIPGAPPLPRCSEVQQPDVACIRSEGADGSLEMRFGTVIDGSTYRFLTVRVAPDGFVIEALDDVQAGSWAAAGNLRSLTDAETTSLVQDPALTFPAPVHAPPPPAPHG
jgi:hypothetical protein